MIHWNAIMMRHVAFRAEKRKLTGDIACDTTLQESDLENLRVRIRRNRRRSNWELRVVVIATIEVFLNVFVQSSVSFEFCHSFRTKKNSSLCKTVLVWVIMMTTTTTSMMITIIARFDSIAAIDDFRNRFPCCTDSSFSEFSAYAQSAVVDFPTERWAALATRLLASVWHDFLKTKGCQWN